MQTCGASKSPPSNNPLLPPPGLVKVNELKCEWTPEEEKHLILFLIAEVTAAAAEMERYPTKGALKTSKACSSKYTQVLYCMI
jgi:hypothetical protein